MAELVTQPTTPAEPPKPVPVVPETPPASKPDDMSAKFAALAKKERMLRMNFGQHKAKESALAERERKIAEREAQWESEFKTSPLEAIKKRGYSYEDLTKAALNDGKFDAATEVKEVRSEIERLRQEQADKDKKAQENATAQQTAAEQEAVETFKTNISTFIETNKEKYELTALYDASELVFQTVEEHFERTKKEGKPKILTVDEACGLVESYLESELERTATSSKKFQAKYQAAKQADPKQAPKSSVTLSNEHTSTAPSLLPAHTEEDRIKRALAKLSQ